MIVPGYNSGRTVADVP